MADYIRREDALKALYNDYAYAAMDVIKRLPAAYVAEVVRCKGCKYGVYDSKPNGAMVCLRTNDGFWRKETDFCSYGEYQTNTGGSNNADCICTLGRR
nr:MAG TPA: hypothetical protein [Caudoviricetes sp.]